MKRKQEQGSIAVIFLRLPLQFLVFKNPSLAPTNNKTFSKRI